MKLEDYLYVLCNSVKLWLNCRVLGFRRVPLTVGRVIDLEDDVLPVATERLRNTFFTNGELHGLCNAYCINFCSLQGWRTLI